MARRRGRRGRRGFKIPIVSLAILGGQAALAWSRHGNMTALDEFQGFYTGFHIGSGSFEARRMLVGWGPWLVKGLVSKVARPLGATPRIPFGLPISLS